jgi:hypothetical protein
MKRFVLAACLPLLSGTLALSQVSGTCEDPVILSAPAGLSLSIDVISSEIDIVGGNRDNVRITCRVSNDDRPEGIHVRADCNGSSGTIRVTGPHPDSLHILVEVPRQTNFRLRIPAGEVKVNDVSGDKDIAVNAGEVIVSKLDSSQYHSIHASVDIGDVHAPAFGPDKGGFFRSFNKSNANGPYRLRVHVITGSIKLD